MLDLVRLSEVLENGENTMKYVVYKPDYEESVVLTPEQTGWGSDQEVCQCGIFDRLINQNQN